ncbi:MAG: nucleotidyltransferase domain-containing protein [Candidatus Bathyarchaeia archaeon]
MRIYFPEFNRERLIEKLRKGSEVLSKKLPIKKVVLFGSYAEGRHTVASDVDLLVIYRGEKQKDDYDLCWDSINIPQIELHIYTEDEYERLRISGSSIHKEIERKGITIWP